MGRRMKKTEKREKKEKEMPCQMPYVLGVGTGSHVTSHHAMSTTHERIVNIVII